MALERKKTLNVFKEARSAWGSFDEFPVGPKGTDPMPYLSRNRIAQPFFQVSDEDQVIVQMAGTGRIEFKEIDTLEMHLIVGDTVYIPAGTPSRLIPEGENLQLRLKAEPPGRDAVAWYCDTCDELIHFVEFPAGLPHEHYLSAVNQWNSDEKLRTCKCGAIAPRAELGDIKWSEVAAALRAED